MRNLCAVVLVAFLSISTGFSKSVKGIDFADELTVKNQKLVLNGLGWRKATIFGIKVYLGGLYLKEKSSDYSKFASSESPKKIIMHFVRDVEKKDLAKGWKESIAQTFPKGHKLDSQVKSLLAALVDIKEGQRMSYNFLNDGVEALVNGKVVATMKGSDFSKALLGVWFNNPVDKGLASGLLNK
jgi:hypothetical protein